MPTTAFDTYSIQKLEPVFRGDLAVEDVQTFAPSLTIARGTVLGRITASGRLAAYNNANSNGTETAVAIAMYDLTTDASGNVTLAHEKATSQPAGPVYIGGYFLTTELTGLDAAGVTDLGRIVRGTLASGVIKIN